MARVRKYTRQRDGKTETVRQHTRRGGGIKLRPRRAWFNLRRAHWSLQKRQRVRAVLFAGAAVSEITAFTVFRAAGGILAVTGVVLALLGAGLYESTKG